MFNLLNYIESSRELFSVGMYMDKGFKIMSFDFIAPPHPQVSVSCSGGKFTHSLTEQVLIIFKCLYALQAFSFT